MQPSNEDEKIISYQGKQACQLETDEMIFRQWFLQIQSHTVSPEHPTNSSNDVGLGLYDGVKTYGLHMHLNGNT